MAVTKAKIDAKKRELILQSRQHKLYNGGIVVVASVLGTRLVLQNPLAFVAELSWLSSCGYDNVVFDLGKVEEVTSLSLAALLNVYIFAEENRRVAFAELQPRVLYPLRQSGLDALLAIYETEQQALESFY